jgi:hypothetical protein
VAQSVLALLASALPDSRLPTYNVSVYPFASGWCLTSLIPPFPHPSARYPCREAPAAIDLAHAAAETVAQSVLALLAAALPDSPGSQAELQAAGGARLLLLLLRAPANTPGLGLGAIQVLGLLATRGQPGAQAEVTAGGLVAVVMNVLQQQAMAGVLVSEVRGERGCCQ